MLEETRLIHAIDRSSDVLSIKEIGICELGIKNSNVQLAIKSLLKTRY